MQAGGRCRDGKIHASPISLRPKRDIFVIQTGNFTYQLLTGIFGAGISFAVNREGDAMYNKAYYSLLVLLSFLALLGFTMALLFGFS